MLELSGASHTWLLSANDAVGLRRWASQLRRAHQQALLAMHHSEPEPEPEPEPDPEPEPGP